MSRWSQVLGVERVGVHDNVFDLGGHPLMAMRLIMAVQDMLGVDVSLCDVFEGPTIEQMLAVIFAQSEEDVFDPARSESFRVDPRPVRTRAARPARPDPCHPAPGSGPRFAMRARSRLEAEHRTDPRIWNRSSWKEWMMLSKEALSQMTPEQFRALRRKAQAIPVQPRDGQDFPASYAQQRLWFLSQVGASSDAYHIPLGVELTGALDREALQWSLDQLMVRHESLRTTFAAVDGVPYQRIAAPTPFVLVHHDLRGLDAAAQQTELRSLQVLESDAPFDLEHGPLLRGRVIALGDAPEGRRHVLLLTMHHIVSDGWSMGVLSRELEALYSARVAGGANPLPALPVQYADYAVWQRQRLQGERLQRESDYWREALRGAPALLTLPTDRKRPLELDYRGALIEIALEAPLTQALKALSLKHGATLYMTLLAAWAVVISRLSGQTDVVMGTPVANRARSETQGLIGFFVNTLSVRAQLDDNPTASALIERMKAQVLSAQEYQDLPFEQVVEVVNPARSLAYAPIFQTMLAWQNNESGDLRFGGLDARHLRMPHAVSKFDLTLSLGESEDGGIVGEVEYSMSLFDKATAERYFGYLAQVLRGMAADATRPVGKLPMLGEDEYRQVVQTWNATECDFGPWRPVHASMEDHAASSPHAEAVSCGDRTLDYATLNAGANRLAHWLRDQGVGADALVGLYVQRSVLAIEAVLGIMKSGGAYVPVDTVYPQERVAEMLADARPALILTDAASRAALEAALSGIDAPPPVFEIDGDRPQWSQASTANLSPQDIGLTADHLAYVIYTSGSTGTPKGVMARHGGPTALMHALREPLGLSAQTRVLQFASFGFDAFVLEWVMAFANGGSLHLAEPGEVLLGETLEGLVARRQATHALISPVVLASMPESMTLASMRMLTSGGEAVPPSLARRWSRGRHFFNFYGPTETTVLSTAYLCPPEPEAADTIPLGGPLPNERIYVLDPERQPVPVGVTGEIYIGGAGVARGYLHRPELTAERFIDSPFVAGDRLYRTGDLGRWRADGLVEYRGRNDFQVKIRGYRIELGEIEAKLAALPGVKEAVVLAREDVPGHKQLVAYYLRHDAVDAGTDAGIQADTHAGPERLRAQLQSLLPDYMVPTAFVPLDVWPLTGNGKLDRKALPPPDGATVLAGRPYVAPRTPIEEVLAAMWAELLGVEQVGVHDNFFDLGGHSLMAMRLIAAIRDTFGIGLTLKMFFETPTVEHMGRCLLPDEV
jgi:pristinamycin I synthase 3 and 4